MNLKNENLNIHNCKQNKGFSTFSGLCEVFLYTDPHVFSPGLK